MMFDFWNKEDLANARNLWLPIILQEGMPVIYPEKGEEMKVNIKEIPFSCYGSYFVFSHVKGFQYTEELYLRTVHGQERFREMFQLSLLQNGKTLSFSEEATESCLCLRAGEAMAEICFETANILRFRIQNCRLRLSLPVSDNYQLLYPMSMEKNTWEINAYSHKLLLTPLVGSVGVEAPWNETKAEYIALELNREEAACFEGALEEYETVWEPKEYTCPFDQCVRRVQESYLRFLEAYPAVGTEFAPAREKAAYLNWSAMVQKAGNIKRDGMLMSKNWMSCIWSWDHCFNAMALAKGNPALGWDQLMVLFDNADEFGAMPDCITDSTMIRNFVKPPIHGIALDYFLKHAGAFITEERLREIYGPLKNWTEWWFRYRDFDGDGIPQYHHGNDSGWDNATVFMDTPLVEGLDLSAFLVVQLQILAKLAGLLGREEEGQSFKNRANALRDKMLKHFLWNGRLKSLSNESHKAAEGNSLIDCMPLVLGEELPALYREQMVQEIKNSFLTEYGLATEAPVSPYYQCDGYWRGPIWAPSTYLICYGLEKSGEADLSREIKRRFCAMCAEKGFAENFDACTGKALRDKAYTWTSSVFLLFAEEVK